MIPGASTTYSMFGFQRIGDLCWQAGDQQARGFDRRDFRSYSAERRRSAARRWSQPHSVALTIPNAVSLTTRLTHEVAVIMHDGLERMYGEKQERLLLHHRT